MKKRIITGIAMTGIVGVSAVLAGCGGQTTKQAGITKDSLIEKAVDTFAKMESLDADIDMNMDVTMSATGLSISMKNDSEMNVAGITDGTSHVKGKMNLVAMGQDRNVDIESYTVKEGNDLIQYSKASEAGTDSGWTYTKAGEGFVQSASELDVSKISEAAEKLGEACSDLKLHDETVNYNNVNCYLMDGTIKGDKLAKMMSESGQDVDQASAENLKNMDFDTSIYFRANDETPYAIEIDLGKAIEGVLAAQSQQMQEIQGLDISAEEMKVKVIFNAFNNVKEISVPEDVKKSAIEGDATFDMQDFMGVDGI